jgi:hypothetical protein
MLADEVATYLAGIGELDLLPGENLFSIPWPESAPDACVQVVETGAERPEHSFGASLTEPIYERDALAVLVRDGPDLVEAARSKALAIHKTLEWLGDTNLSGVRYYLVRAEPPQWLDFDDNGRPVFHFACEVLKQRSSS